MDRVVKIACVGDSVVYGFGIEGDRERYVWTAVLERILNESAEAGVSYEVRNYGLNGQSVLPGIYVPAGQRETPLYRQMMQWKPDGIFLHIGGNDSNPLKWDLRRFDAAYRELAEELVETAGRRQVCLFESTYALDEEGAAMTRSRGLDRDIVVNQVNPVIRKTAEELGTNLIDITTVFLNVPGLNGRWQDLFYDEVHPNAAGNEVIAEAACAVCMDWRPN